MLLNKFFAAALMLFGGAAAFAVGVFELKENGKSYTLDFNGNPLIVSEGFMPGFVPEKTLTEKSGNDLILSAWGNSHNIKWRREAATVENGKEVELTFQAPAQQPLRSERSQRYEPSLLQLLRRQRGNCNVRQH